MSQAAPLPGPEATPVPSPCIGLCRMDAAHGWCEGCHRTIEEITAWSRLPDEGKRAIWALLPARRDIAFG